ncbi:hypothetical protein [uncultured Sphingomonas sp.]|uniref:hypothetical protein n=1 Tax=uncultured Sphingomonas sp. TaxID=158754 RepID=UPI00374A5127
MTYCANSLLIVSLFLPVYAELKRPAQIAYGFHILQIGFLGPLICQYGWIGNLVLPIAALWRSRWPRLICAVAFINSLFWWYVADDGGEREIVHLIGYYVWMTAMFIGALSLFWLKKERQ